MNIMDSVFLLEGDERSSFLQRMLRSLGFTYVCLWSYAPQPTDCLVFHCGMYDETSNRQPSSSSGGTLARRLFDDYSESVHGFHNCRIPGYCFKNKLSYLELKRHDLHSLATSEVQLQFYTQSGIKTTVFMGCATGEIELGMLNEPQVDLEIEMKNLFPMDFSKAGFGPVLADRTRPSSSFSTLRSLSFDGSEPYSPLMFNNIPIASSVQQRPKQILKSIPNLILHDGPHQQAIKPFVSTSTNPSLKLSTIESDDAAIEKAILAVLSSSSPSSSQKNTLKYLPSISRGRDTAFKSYGVNSLAPIAAINRRRNMFKRAVLFFRNLHARRIQEFHIQESRPTTSQLHHMMSERKRREKLNECYEMLRSLLPLGSKKDKASVLSSTIEYLSSLRGKVEEVSKRNMELEAQLLNRSETSKHVVGSSSSSSSSSQERLAVEINQVSASAAEESVTLELKITVRGEYSVLDWVTRMLEWLKQQKNMELLSLKSNTSIEELIPIHGMVTTLKINQGDVFDEYGFQESVTRILDDHLSR